MRSANQTSDPISATSGVPQGSHLGPLLFTLFINDLPKFLNDCNFLLYADDLKIFIHLKQESECNVVQENISKLKKWCRINNLYLNVSKMLHHVL